MDEQQARTEAVRQWGEHAVVSFDESTCLALYMVGVQRPDAEEPEWLGLGRSWELAFEEARLRARRGR